MITESWDAVFADATRDPQSPLANALQTLFGALNGLYNTRTALFNFVEHRSDWWAYTLGAEDAVAAATARLAHKLAIDDGTAAGRQVWQADARAELQEFLTLLARHPTPTNQALAADLAHALETIDDPLAAIEAIRHVFFTGKGERRKRKTSNAQCKAMGVAGEQRFLQLHDTICERLEQFKEQRNRQTTLDTNRAWYLAGSVMLAHYQRIKRERRLLDFADLEWHAFELLNHPEQTNSRTPTRPSGA